MVGFEDGDDAMPAVIVAGKMMMPGEEYDADHLDFPDPTERGTVRVVPRPLRVETIPVPDGGAKVRLMEDGSVMVTFLNAGKPRVPPPTDVMEVQAACGPCRAGTCTSGPVIAMLARIAAHARRLEELMDEFHARAPQANPVCTECWWVGDCENYMGNMVFQPHLIAEQAEQNLDPDGRAAFERLSEQLARL